MQLWTKEFKDLRCSPKLVCWSCSPGYTHTHILMLSLSPSPVHPSPCEQEFPTWQVKPRVAIMLSASRQHFSSWMRNRLPLLKQHDHVLWGWCWSHQRRWTPRYYKHCHVLTRLHCLSNSVFLCHQSWCWAKLDCVYKMHLTAEFLGLWEGEPAWRLCGITLIQTVRNTCVTSLFSHQKEERRKD